MHLRVGDGGSCSRNALAWPLYHEHKHLESFEGVVEIALSLVRKAQVAVNNANIRRIDWVLGMHLQPAPVNVNCLVNAPALNQIHPLVAAALRVWAGGE